MLNGLNSVSLEKTLSVSPKRDYRIQPDALERWRKSPGGVSSYEHEAFCFDGMVATINDNDVHCPICQSKKAIELLAKRLESFGVPLAQFNRDWKDLNCQVDEAFKRCQTYATKIREAIVGNHSLLLTGRYGRGKTMSATLIAKAAVNAGYKVGFFNLSWLAVVVRDGYDSRETSEKKAIEALSEPHLLILDDLGAEEADSLALERRMLYLALDKRAKAGLPSVITSNYSYAELIKGESRFRGVGSRIMNRLEPLTIIEFSHETNFRLRQESELFC